ncbi:MAG: metallopeptidase TldD-related protein [Kofleriaceae bacterium]
MNRALVATALGVALGLAATAAPLGAAPTERAKTAPPSAAVTPEILDAVAAEMNRAMIKLHIGDATVPRPYHISFKVTEVEVNDVVASLGATRSRKERHVVSLEARVRVGTPAFDNGNFVVPGDESVDGTAATALPLEATPRIAARAAWLVTDAAYKEALMQLRAKLDARRSGAITGGAVPSWTPEPALVDETQVRPPELEGLADLEALAQGVSAVFRGAAGVRDSRVAFTSYLERRWYLTSEGTNVTDTRRVSGVVIAASSQAPDGQELLDYVVRYGHTGADLPTAKALEADAQTIVDNLAALRAAPIADEYTGPVLFEGEGAAGMVRHSLAPNLGGTPLPGGLRPNEAKQFGGALTKKVGLRVTSKMLSITDDPTQQDAEAAMIGGYKIDDEGVAGRRVAVVERGMLTSLLTSRTPSSKDATSNGHARRTTSGGAFHGSATNLLISATGGQTRKALVAKLLAAAKAEGLPYGMIIRRFDDAAITAMPELSRRELVQMIQAADTDLPPPALIAYRVYPDGREELVRGAQLAEIPIRAWKDVLAAGKTRTVYNYLATSDTHVLAKAQGGTDEGFVPSAGIESAIVTPDLLFKELDVITNTAGQRPLPAIAPPPIAASP